jgi:sugar-specific transcriptional regulator TrmB
VYRILRELSSHGLVQRNPCSPSTFTATAPDRAVSLLLNRSASRLSVLEQRKAEVISSLSSYTYNAGVDTEERFSLMTGGQNLIVKARQMIADTKQDYVSVMSKYGLKRIKETGIANAIVGARRRKVRFRVISEIDASNFKSADLLRRHVEVRRNSGLLFYLGIADKKELVLGPAVTDEEASERNSRELDLWTNNERFIEGMYAMFERIWEASPKYEKLDSWKC